MIQIKIEVVNRFWRRCTHPLLIDLPFDLSTRLQQNEAKTALWIKIPCQNENILFKYVYFKVTGTILIVSTWNTMEPKKKKKLVHSAEGLIWCDSTLKNEYMATTVIFLGIMCIQCVLNSLMHNLTVCIQ